MSRFSGAVPLFCVAVNLEIYACFALVLIQQAQESCMQRLCLCSAAQCSSEERTECCVVKGAGACMERIWAGGQ